jgi:hypothetical protein
MTNSEGLSGLVGERLRGLPEGTRQAILDRVEQGLPDFVAGIVEQVAGDERQRSQSGLRAAYEIELAKIPRGRVEAVVALQSQYRRRGLDV